MEEKEDMKARRKKEGTLQGGKVRRRCLSKVIFRWRMRMRKVQKRLKGEKERERRGEGARRVMRVRRMEEDESARCVVSLCWLYCEFSSLIFFYLNSKTTFFHPIFFLPHTQFPLTLSHHLRQCIFFPPDLCIQ